MCIRDSVETTIAEQTQPREPKDSMEHIRHVTGSVRKAASLWILQKSGAGGERRAGGTYLTAQYEGNNLLPVNPMQSTYHSHTAHYPPAITHVFKLFGSTIKTSIGELPLAQPATESVNIHEIQASCNRHGADTGENLA